MDAEKDDPEMKVGSTWLAFSGDTEPEFAELRFRQRFGIDPPSMIRVVGLLMVGPVPEV